MRYPLAGFLLLLSICVNQSCTLPKLSADADIKNIPKELIQFSRYEKNPIFSGSGSDTWDKQIRERGFILKDNDTYHLWYTGYSNKDITKFLGYATSTDGINWKRYQDEPIYKDGWVEDVFVIKSANTYYMFAEGRGDTAHMLTSSDKINWTEKGNLNIVKTDGTPIDKGAFGTPTVFIEDGIWHLFYERDDRGIWLATSTDREVWKNVQDEPVIAMGPSAYDSFAVAMNQVIKYKGLYYGYYHASAYKDWREWSTNIAVSKDLVHWKKYDKNPILGNNESSGILVPDGNKFRMYTMHRKINVYLPK